LSFLLNICISAHVDNLYYHEGNEATSEGIEHGLRLNAVSLSILLLFTVSGLEDLPADAAAR
jgi:hypothetical protein